MIELFTQLLLGLNKILFNNLGLTIIVVGIVPRIILHPLLASSLRYSKTLQEIKPKLDQLKKTHGSNTKKLLEAQSKVFKESGINQVTGSLGCLLNTAIQIGVFILLFQSLSKVINSGVETHFLFWDLAARDTFKVSGLPIALPGLLVILTGIFSLFQSKMILPTSQPSSKKQNKEADFSQVLASSQSQTAYFIPIIILITGTQFPAGLALYWLVGTVFAIIQQYFITGLGGLTPWVAKLKLRG